MKQPQTSLRTLNDWNRKSLVPACETGRQRRDRGRERRREDSRLHRCWNEVSQTVLNKC